MIHSFRKFFEFAGRQSRNWYLGLFYEIIRCILEALQFAALLVVLDGLVHDNITAQTALLAFGIMLVSVIGTAIFWYLAHGKEGEGSYRMCEDKRIQIGNRMKYMPMGYFNSHSLGNLTSVSTATMSDLESMSFAVIVRTLVGVIHASIFSVAMSYFSWKISLIFLTGVILFMVINTMLLRCSKRLSPIRLDAQTEFMDAVLEYIQGMSVVRAFHMAKQSNTALEKSIDETQRKNQLIERQRIPYIAAEQVVLRIASAAAAFCSIALFINGTLELTYCLIILVSAFMVYSQLESAGEMFFMLSMIDASIDRVEEINQSPQIDIDGKEQTPDRLDIEMQDVSFSYGDKKVIDHVSLTIPQGTTTAIVGPSGSGKTTLVNLIARFWDVDSGSVRIGGIDVKDYKLDSLMKNISMVFQNVYLFPDTIENNIKFGCPNATHEDVVKAAKAARCHDFISAFANNLCGLLKTAKGCMSMNGKTYMANQRIKTCYMVMQDVNHQLFTESVMDEILLSLDNSDEEKAAHEAESIMESLHISEFRDAHPMSLSGGQKQRVAIASAIASDKQVIVFDEPTSGLDYRHMKKVAENLRELSSLGKTLFIVTHDPELIAECCNYFVFIENGKVLWSDGWNRISRERLQRFFAFEGD